MNNVTGFKCVECAREFRIQEIEYVCAACGGDNKGCKPSVVLR